MNKPNSFKRLIAGIVAVSMAAANISIPIGADEAGKVLSIWDTDVNADPRLNPERPVIQDETIPDDQIVRVSIVLEDDSTINAGYELDTIATDADALAYRDDLKTEQETVVEKIEKQILRGGELDVVWNLTLAANIISANVEYGLIEEIKKINGVKDVVIEMQYAPAETVQGGQPNMANSSVMIGSAVAYDSGYTGAGSVVAIVDTGIAVGHQSFDPAAFAYSLEKNGYTGELLTKADIAELVKETNAYLLMDDADVDDLYYNSKIPFGFSYIDGDFNISHNNVEGGSAEHGSHVAGIAAANAYIPDGNGGYNSAIDSVMVQGVAPDAQILVMKVFGQKGGSFDSDCMAAIEDAIILGADSINLSLGSPMAGFSYGSNTYEDVMNSLLEHGAVVTISAGNDGYWAENSEVGYLYSDDINYATNGSPGSYTHSLTVASIDNTATNNEYLKVGNEIVYYRQSMGYGNHPFYSLSETMEYVVIDGVGAVAKLDGKGNVIKDKDGNAVVDYSQFEKIKDVVKGKVVLCSRGDTSFFQKANAAYDAGAAAVIIINNEPGVLGLILTGYYGNIPVVAVTQDSGKVFWDNASEPVSCEGLFGRFNYAVGTLTVPDDYITEPNSTAYQMSEFSSWGVPESLELKPEITAPGGNIWSVNGLPEENDQYEDMSGTSMAAPQVAGMAAVLSQYIDESEELSALVEEGVITKRQLIQSLLMSTAEPVADKQHGNSDDYYYPVLTQGAGLANVGNAVQANSYILMDEEATLDPNSALDGKVKAELGEIGKEFSFTFTINNFSGEEITYALDTQLFTQYIIGLPGDSESERLATFVDSVAANISYDFNGYTGVTVFENTEIDADVNKDGHTTPADAQALLNYLTSGKAAGLDFDAGDVDEDGEITTYDAYLILVATKSLLTVPAGGSVEVTVNAEITKDLSSYVNGAYIEGYTFVEPFDIANSEGVIADVTHSIPILGFYGSWSQPSMFEPVEAVDYYYFSKNYEYDRVTGRFDKVGSYEGAGRHDMPYSGYFVNSLWIETEDGDDYYQMGNPYVIEKKYASDKLAIRSTDTLTEYDYALIRNAGTVATLITDGDGNILDLDIVALNRYAEFYYLTSNGASWEYSGYAARINTLVGDLGVKENDEINVSVVAIPEYYGVYGRDFGAADVVGILNVLGDGAFLTTSMTVDDTAPVISEVKKDETTGDVFVTVSDNQYVAYLALLSRSGAVVYADAVPNMAQGGTVTFVFDGDELRDNGIRQNVIVFAADYAGNETTKAFEYNTATADYAGEMLGYASEFLTDGYDYIDNAWMLIDPAEIDFWTEAGAVLMDRTPVSVTAAAYADDYIFQIGSDGVLYVSPVDDPGYFSHKAAYLEFNAVDLAFNYADSQLYALDDENGIWMINPLTGSAEFVGYLAHQFLYEAIGLTIDAGGTFYAAGYFAEPDEEGEIDAFSSLFTWNADDVENGIIKLECNDDIFNDDEYYFYADAGVLAYDYDNDLIYMAANAGYIWDDADSALLYDWLYVIDVNEGYADYTGEGYLYNDMFYISNLGTEFRSLFVVPGDDNELGGEIDDSETETVENITLNAYELNLMVGNKAQLSAIVSPWTLKDTSVIWSSEDTSVAVVNENGTVTAKSEGTTTVTAAAKADPTVTASVEVTVIPVPSVDLRAHVCDAEGEACWSRFNTSTLPAFEKLSEHTNYYYSATISAFEDTIYAYDGRGYLYAIDPDTFETVEIGYDYTYGDITFAYEGTYNSGDNIIAGVHGTDFYLINTSTLDGDGWDLSRYLNVPIAAVSWAGATYFGKYNEFVDLYYLLLENGDLYQFGAGYDADTGELVTDSFYGPAYLGNIGIEIPGATYGQGIAFASLLVDLYSGDEDADHVYLSYYNDGDAAAHLAMFDVVYYEEYVDVVVLTEGIDFDYDVWPAIGLYQYGEDYIPAEAASGDAARFADTKTAAAAEEILSLGDRTAQEPESEAEPVYPVGSLNSVNSDPVVADIIDITEQEITDEQLEVLGNSLTVGEAVIDKENNTITIPVEADSATNAMYALEYDSELLTLSSVERLTVYSSGVDDGTSVLLNFASADAVSDVVSRLVFTYDEADESGLNTEIILMVYELGVETDEGLLVALGGSENTPVVKEQAEIDIPEAGNPGGGSGSGSGNNNNNNSGNTPSAPKDVEVNINLGGNGTTNAPSTIKSGEDLKFTITPKDGYKLPDHITVTIDGKVLDPSEYSYNSTTGKVVIPGNKITGKVKVDVNFVPIKNDQPNVTPDNGDRNPSTGVTLTVLPVLTAACAAVVFRKRRKAEPKD